MFDKKCRSLNILHNIHTYRVFKKIGQKTLLLLQCVHGAWLADDTRYTFIGHYCGTEAYIPTWKK
jgi:hypothetical protein